MLLDVRVAVLGVERICPMLTLAPRPSCNTNRLHDAAAFTFHGDTMYHLWINPFCASTLEHAYLNRSRSRR